MSWNMHAFPWTCLQVRMVNDNDCIRALTSGELVREITGEEYEASDRDEKISSLIN